MARRLPSQPPTLPGFTYVRMLGSGGFADVFLYEQNMPRRQVAVKVMLAEVVTTQVRQMFQAEANLMAQLSTHPSILTVYQASVSSDGRPYLVMELCSASIGQRYRAEPLRVPDVLSIGVRISSAVETAHRSGVLHRDIKPSNILTTAYGHPVLSDFGIAATLSDIDASDTVGMSIPWSAPEVLLDDTPGTVASEVWSLSATLYSLLAGHSPFESATGDNTSAQLVSRITRSKPVPIGRTDVPPRLESVLMRAMSRKAENRQQSALELIRELQSVEAELGLSQTPLEVALDDWALATAEDPADRTRVNAITAVDPAGRRRRRVEPAAVAPSARTGGQTGGRTAGVTALRGGGTGSREPQTVGHTRMTRALVVTIVVSSVLVLALATTALLVLVRAQNGTGIPVVSDISDHVAGSTVTFSWNDPGVEPDDTYQVVVGSSAPSVQRGTQFSTSIEAGERVCITVSVDRQGKLGQPSAQKCVDRPGGS